MKATTHNKTEHLQFSGILFQIIHNIIHRCQTYRNYFHYFSFFFNVLALFTTLDAYEGMSREKCVSYGNGVL